MLDICAKCGLPHEGQGVADLCVAAQSNAVKRLLAHVGQPSTCRGCHAPIFFVKHLNGANTPYDPSGISHFATCPKANDFKKAANR